MRIDPAVRVFTVTLAAACFLVLFLCGQAWAQTEEESAIDQFEQRLDQVEQQLEGEDSAQVSALNLNNLETAVSVTPSSVAPGQMVQITGMATSSAEEVHDRITIRVERPNGRVVASHTFRDVALAVGETVQKTLTWTVPATAKPGSYQIVMEVIGRRRSILGSGAATLTVTAARIANGQCGSANGTATASAPSSNLCSAGTASAVSASGTAYSWSCGGSDGGTTASCSAPELQVINGTCGSANGAELASAPAANLCTTGLASTVSGSGPWIWTCSGANGGTTSSCSAEKAAPTALNGQCGRAGGVASQIAPGANLCAVGTATTVSGGGTLWSWSCAGSNGGTTAQCTAPELTATNGQCGSANGVASAVTPSNNLCSAGTASFPTGNGTTYSWSCAGAGGGTTASCSAPELPVVNGACGSSNGAQLSAAPTANLCIAGTTSLVSGSGPWTWSCAGANGGTSVSCTAQVAGPAKVNGACGPAAATGTTTAPSGGLCASGTATAVKSNGAGSFEWDCDGSNDGSSVFCITPAAGVVNGTCGSANGSQVTSAPSANLCSTGTATAVSADGSGWQWDCQGANGGETVVCTASPTPVNGTCGTANGSHPASAPTGNLCGTGTASAVSGSGPWTWSCTGSNGGSTATCSASPAVNGSCGSAQGVTSATAPSSNLCAVGTASSVNGSGTAWSWSCTGSNGGTTASCMAPASQVNGTCGSAASVATTTAPTANLCSSGTAGDVNTSGGRFEWECYGSIGGTTAVCETPAGTTSTAVNGQCGAAASTYTNTAPTSNLCAAGTPSTVEGIGSPWSWDCYGTGADSTDVLCQASSAPVNAVCGPANGVPTTTEPATSSLCSVGTPVIVTNPGQPWSWTCMGSDNTIPLGATVSCSAPNPSLGGGAAPLCGADANVTTNTEPSANLCVSGATASSVRGAGPWFWTCSQGSSTSMCQDFFPDGQAPTGPAFYVATNGNDSNPGTLDAPFATPQRAAQAMENSSTKTTYVRGGTYNVSSPGGTCIGVGPAAVALGPSDSGETWSYYPPDGFDSAIIDGGTNLACAFDMEGDSSMTGITIDGLTIQNFAWQGIVASGGSNISVVNNIIHDIPAPIGQGGRTPFVAAIQFECSGNSSSWGGFTVNHNYIYNVGQDALRIDNGAYTDTPCPVGQVPTNTVVEYNYTQDTCTAFGDCGSIYFENISTDSSHRVVVSYNYFKDDDPADGTFFTTSLDPNGVYFDGGDSYFTMQYNIVAGTYMQDCYGIDGAGQIVMQYNICDNEGAAAAAAVWWDAISATPFSIYTGNVFENGISISNSGNAGSGFQNSGYAMTVQNNLYWGYGSATPNDSGDSSPVTGQDPNFTCGWTYTVSGGSIPSIGYTQPANDLGIAWGQPGFWGPPGFVIPETGTQPSPPTTGCTN